MTDAEAKLIALRHYRTKWYGQEWAAITAAWETEYAAVSTGAFTSLEIFSSSMEGSSHGARKNFEQSIRTAALQDYRASKDADYAAEIYAEPPSGAQGPTVTYPLFAQNAFPH